jgi:hypothetical protein
LELTEITRYLAKIEQEATITSLTLDSSPEQWRQTVSNWTTSGNQTS